MTHPSLTGVPHFVPGHRRDEPPAPPQAAGVVGDIHIGGTSERGGRMDLFVWAAESAISRFAATLYILGSWSGHILLFLLPLIQEGQLSVTGESICTRYWLTDLDV